MRALAAALFAVRLPGHVPVSRLPNSSEPTQSSTRYWYAQNIGGNQRRLGAGCSTVCGRHCEQLNRLAAKAGRWNRRARDGAD